MRLEEKKDQAKMIEQALLDSSASYVVDFRGLKVEELTELRRSLRESNAQFQVVKNTLARRGATTARVGSLESLFDGPSAIIFARTEPVAPAKTLKVFAQEHPNLHIRGGVLNDSILDQERVLLLAEIPSREVLLTQLLGQIQSPIQSFLTALVAPLQAFVFVVNSIIEDTKGGSSMPATSKQEEAKAGTESKKSVVIEAIQEMNILELSELVKELEDKFGVKAVMPQVAVAAAPAQAGASEEEKVEFDVILAEVGGKKIQVIKEVRKLTSLGLKEAKDLVEAAPKPVREGVTKEEADKIKETLEAVGAKVELK